VDVSSVLEDGRRTDEASIAITQNIYIKSVTKSRVSAMDSLSEKLGTCNDLATPAKRSVN
jgi:hypothetical protein